MEAAKKTSTRAKGPVGGFMEFVRQQGVVGLAVGLAVGTQAAELVKSIVSSLITPLFDLLIGSGGLRGVSWTVRLGYRVSTFQFGILMESLLKFMAVAVVIYVVVMGFKLDKLDMKKE